MNWTAEQKAAIAKMYTLIVAALNVVVSGQQNELCKVDLRLDRIEMTLYIVSNDETTAAPETDADFLRSLKIAPELTPSDRTS